MVTYVYPKLLITMLLTGKATEVSTLSRSTVMDHPTVTQRAIGNTRCGMCQSCDKRCHNTHTEHRRQYHQPSPDVGKGLHNLFLLDSLVCCPYLIVTNTLQSSDSLLSAQHSGMDRRIRKPNQNNDPDDDRQPAQEQENDLVCRNNFAVVV